MLLRYVIVFSHFHSRSQLRVFHYLFLFVFLKIYSTYLAMHIYFHDLYSDIRGIVQTNFHIGYSKNSLLILNRHYKQYSYVNVTLKSYS